jgi:hypothetical protein
MKVSAYMCAAGITLAIPLATERMGIVRWIISEEPWTNFGRVAPAEEYSSSPMMLHGAASILVPENLLW